MNRIRIIAVIVVILILGGLAGYLILSGQGSSNNSAADQQAANQFYADRSGSTPIPQLQAANGSGGALIGIVQQVSGNQLIVNSGSGTVTVTLETTGTVGRQDRAQLSDIHTGDTVNAIGNLQGVTMTAQLVQIGSSGATSGGPMMVQLSGPLTAGASGTPGQQNYVQKNSDSGQGSLPSAGQPVRGKVMQVANNILTIQAADGSVVAATLDGNTVIQKQTAIPLSDIQNGDHVVVRGQQSGGSIQASNILVLPKTAGLRGRGAIHCAPTNRIEPG